ncbi:CUB domain-containing protein [Methanoculleus sp. UBA303]|jgi:hypothetical protein|uniref:CUB domain-containing protein n=1 Tax=Methanoculleus sp. UBA303 TaxID=1915497 RepID=UPI0025FB1089|nr:CUB domain-containing protein [Methanoculleus sp. UBA303]
MKQIFTLAIALLIALAPLGVAAEPLPTDTTGASPPAPEVTYLEPSESQSTNITPLLCVNESSTSGPLLSDIKVGCDESGEYFSESGGSVTVTDTPEPWSVNISESDYDSRDLDQSIIDTCEENGSTEQPEWLTDTVPDGTTTDATLHASVQPSRIRNITVESKHPYANNFTYTWEISDPGAHQMRLHFDKLSLAGSLSHYDTLRIYDELGRELVYYKGPDDDTDFWTAWQTTDTLRVKLVTDSRYTSYGFLIDKVECRDEKIPPTEHLAESYHPYANNYVHTWKISKPGANQMRLHFDKLSLAGSLSHYDTLRIYDELGRELVYYKGPDDGTDFWTAWQTTDTLLVKLVTDSRYTSYGFLIDKVDCRYEKFPPTEHFAESYHPYANNYVHTWKISMPGANKTRLHFDKLSLAGSWSHYDTLRIYDELGRELVYYKGPTDNTDFWTEWQTTDTLRVKLVTDGQYTSYGFLIDLIETEEGVFTPSQIPAPANLTLHPGWNFISVPRPLAAGNDTALIFAPVETDGHSVLRYDAAAGEWVPLVATDRLAPLEGFWMYSTEPSTVLLNFSTDPLLPPAKRSLSTGWNAVGVTSTIPATARDTFHSVNAQWTTLIGFNAGKQAFEAGIVNGGSGTNADTRSVYPGKGYWLYMTEPGTLCAIGA